jgi:hypothetical protein
MGIPSEAATLHGLRRRPSPALLPVLFDFGTNNETLLADPRYMGLRQKRVEVAEADEFFEDSSRPPKKSSRDRASTSRIGPGPTRSASWRGIATGWCSYNDDIQAPAPWWSRA